MKLSSAALYFARNNRQKNPPVNVPEGLQTDTRDKIGKLAAEAKERQKRKPANSVPVTLPEQKGDTRDKIGKPTPAENDPEGT